MDPRDFLYFIRRHLRALVVLLVLGGLLSWGYHARHSSPDYGALLFLTIGTQVSQDAPVDPYPTSEIHNVSDYFAETVQGWFFNPSFLSRVSEQAGTELSLSVRKQERQNLLVTVSVDSPEAVDSASQAVLNVLNDDLAEYNRSTNMDFVVALNSMSPFERHPHFILTLFIGMSLTLIVSLLGLFNWEYFRRRLSVPFQFKSITGTDPLMIFSFGFCRSQFERTLPLYRRHFPKESTWMDMTGGRLNDHAKWLKAHAKIQVLSCPADLSHDKALHNGVFVFQLGQTLEEDVRAIRRFVDSDFAYFLIV